MGIHDLGVGLSVKVPRRLLDPAHGISVNHPRASTCALKEYWAYILGLYRDNGNELEITI